MKISARKVSDLLRRAIKEEIEITCLNPDDAMYCGDYIYRVGDAQITFFNDCYCLDYVDSASVPGYDKTDFDDWCHEGVGLYRLGNLEYEPGVYEPTMLLSYEEKRKLENLLGFSRPYTKGKA